MDVIGKLIAQLNRDDMWFTTETDPIVGLFGTSVDRYIKIDEYGELSDPKEISRISKEILDYIGDGAITEEDAVEIWVRQAFNNGQVWYKDALVTKFKDKQPVDDIEAYELHTESKKLKTERATEGDLIPTGLSDAKAEDVLNSVIGQMSDGMWENVPQMDRFWQYADIVNQDGQIYIKVDRDKFSSGYRDKTDEEVRKYFANKVKQIAKEYIKDYVDQKPDLKWDRNCTENCSYLDYHSGATIQDAYRVYDKLMGRIDRIKTESKVTSEVKQALLDLNVSNFQELRDALDEMLEKDIINEEYEDFLDIISDKEEACEDYIRRRSDVTNTDWKDEMGIESDYVTDAIQEIVGSLLEESKEDDVYKDQLIRSRCASIGTNLTFLRQELPFDEDRARKFQDYIKEEYMSLKELLNLPDEEVIDYAAERDDYTVSKIKLLKTLVDNDFDYVGQKEIKTESKQPLVEENQKSKQVIDNLLTADNFDASTPEGKLILRLSKMYNDLTDDGYDVIVSYSNGEGTVQIPIDKKGGSLIIPVQNENDKLNSTLSGNIPLTIDNMNTFTDIFTTIASL